MNPYGRLVHGQEQEISYELEQPETVVGRSESCDIRLDDPYVSRRQALIVMDKGIVRIENLGRNPILLNGECIEKSVLQSGDMILLGRTQLVFMLQPPMSDASSYSDDGDLDPDMTFLLPEHQALKSVPKPVAAGRPRWEEALRTFSERILSGGNRWRLTPLRAALLLALILIVLYFIF